MSYSRHQVYISDDDDNDHEEEYEEEEEEEEDEEDEDEEEDEDNAVEVVDVVDEIEGEEEEGEEEEEEQHQQQDENNDGLLEEEEINNEQLEEEEEEEQEAEVIPFQSPETSVEVDEIEEHSRRKRRSRREEGESSTSSTKRVKSKRKESNKNEEGGGVPYCSICMEPWYPEGDHQVSCLPCGHVYGLSCINKWIQCSSSRYSKCPQCNQKSRLKDVKTLYISGLTVAYCEQEKKLLSLQTENEFLKMKFKEEWEEKKRSVWEMKRVHDLRYKRLASKMKGEITDMRRLWRNHDKTYKRLDKEHRERMGRMTEQLFGRETIYID